MTTSKQNGAFGDAEKAVWEVKEVPVTSARPPPSDLEKQVVEQRRSSISAIQAAHRSLIPAVMIMHGMITQPSSQLLRCRVIKNPGAPRANNAISREKPSGESIHVARFCAHVVPQTVSRMLRSF